MNLITITGHLGKDPESRKAGAKTVVSASVAVSQGRDKPSMWLEVSAWEDGYTTFAANELAAACKGQKVVVSGRLSMREWTGNDGAVRQSWGITAQDVERVAPKLERAEESASRSGGNVRHTWAPQQTRRPEESASRSGGNVRHTWAPQQTRRPEEVPYGDDKDIPF